METASAAHQPRTIRRPKFDVAERPFIVIWEMTRACDLACAHCRAEAMPWRDPRELSTAEARDLIDEIAAFGLPAPLLVLTGGDPMKRPDLSELVSYAAHRHVPVAFSPSVTPLVTPRAITDLRACGLKALSLSLDGASAQAHDAFRGVEGVFDRTMELWEAARAAGLKVQINTTVARRNLHELPAIAGLVLEHGAMVWSAFFLVPIGRGVALEQISPEQCEDVMHFLCDLGQVIPVKTTEAHHFRRVVAERTILERRGLAPESVLHLGPTYRALRAARSSWPATRLNRRSPMDVNAGRGFVFISHVGTVHGSGFLPVSAGNVREDSLSRIYRESQLFRDLRDLSALQGRCARCEFAAACGGSRSRAFAMTGDVRAEDALCAYVPGSFPFQAEITELLRESHFRAMDAAD
jgi:AdoMet-dependent heme synthase